LECASGVLLFIFEDKRLDWSHFIEVLRVELLLVQFVELLFVLQIVLVDQCSPSQVERQSLFLQVQWHGCLFTATSKECKDKLEFLNMLVVLHSDLLGLTHQELDLANHQDYPGHKDFSLSRVVLVDVSRGYLEVDQ
jgi:hypothetical protein